MDDVEHIFRQANFKRMIRIGAALSSGDWREAFRWCSSEERPVLLKRIWWRLTPVDKPEAPRPGRSSVAYRLCAIQ